MPELLSHIKSNPSTFTPTLKRALSSTLDLCLDWFKQLPSAADVQQKWTQMDAQYNLTGTTVNFFKTSVKYLLNDEQIRHWLYMATCFLVLIVCIRVLICLCWFFGSIISLFISSIVRILFWSISTIVNLVFFPVSYLLWFLRLCLWFGGKSTVKMMKAPGKPTVMIARALFEANPQKYFSNLRGN